MQKKHTPEPQKCARCPEAHLRTTGRRHPSPSASLSSAPPDRNRATMMMTRPVPLRLNVTRFISLKKQLIVITMSICKARRTP